MWDNKSSDSGCQLHPDVCLILAGESLPSSDNPEQGTKPPVARAPGLPRSRSGSVTLDSENDYRVLQLDDDCVGLGITSARTSGSLARLGAGPHCCSPNTHRCGLHAGSCSKLETDGHVLSALFGGLKMQQ